MQLIFDSLEFRTRWSLIDAACSAHPFYVRKSGQWLWTDNSPQITESQLLQWFMSQYAADAARIEAWEIEREQKMKRVG